MCQNVNVQKSKEFQGHEWNQATSSRHPNININHRLYANRRRFTRSRVTWLRNASLLIQ